MGGDLERCQQELEIASKPIAARFVHYQKVIEDIRKLLVDYFFNGKRIQKLSEVPKDNELVFHFDEVKAAMEMCLIDTVFIENIRLNGCTNLITALDSHIAHSGLPIEIQQENSLYIFNPAKNYTPMAQIFMQQFAYALGIYRLGLGIYENYCNILNHAEIQQVQVFKNYLTSAKNIREALKEGGVDLIAYYRHTKASKKEVFGYLRAEKISQGSSQFKANLDKLTTQLSNLLEFGATYLQNCYKVFPNDAILWVLHDRTWHSLLKSFSSLLYANYYTYSTWHSTLVIKREFMALVKSELEHFSLVSLAKITLLKIELLKEAAKSFSESEIDIQANLAEQGIELNEAPTVGLFATSRPSIYQLMAEYYRESNQISPGDDRQQLSS